MAQVGPTGVSASAKEVVIVAGAGVGLIVLLYWLAKREVTGAVNAANNAVKTAATTTAKAVDTSANFINKAGNSVVKHGIDAVLSDEKATQAVKWWDSWSIGTAIYDAVNYESPRG